MGQLLSRSGIDLGALHEFLPYLKPHKSSIVTAVGCITVGAVINIILPIMLRDLSEKEDIDVTSYTIKILILFFIYHAASCYGHYMAAVVARKVDTTLCAAALQKLNTIRFVDAVAQPAEVIAAEITQGSRRTGDCISGALTDLYQSVIFFVCFTIGLVYLSPQMCIILAIVAVLNKTVTSFLSSDFSERSDDLNKCQSAVLKYLINSVTYQSTIRLFGLQAETQKQLERDLNNVRESAKEVDWRLHSSSGAMFCFNNTLYVLLIAAARHFKDEGSLTNGDILIFFFFVKRWLDHVGDIGKEAGKIRVVVGVTKRLREVLRSSACAANALIGQRTIDRGPALHAQSIEYTYGVKGMTMTFELGKLYGMVGRSGEGKTTTMRLLTSLLTPTMGSVERAHRITLCEQDAGILSGTIYDNIAYGQKGATKEDVERAARRAAFDTVVAQLPHGYDTMLRCEGEVPLSGGQIQRLCLARAFCSDAPLMIFDEPTKGLDTAATNRVVASLNDIVKEGRAVVVVTHALHLINNAHNIYVIHQGKVESEGTHGTLSRSCEYYRTLLQEDQEDMK
eukprot:PhM_4_TR14109/c0_g1_i1/m.95256/K06147/ABCB-BAC; ATP-binding cassette, subfamily B, bacterial